MKERGKTLQRGKNWEIKEDPVKDVGLRPLWLSLSEMRPETKSIRKETKVAARQKFEGNCEIRGTVREQKLRDASSAQQSCPTPPKKFKILS